MLTLLAYQRYEWRWEDLNLRPPGCKPGVLPAKLHPLTVLPTASRSCRNIVTPKPLIDCHRCNTKLASDFCHRPIGDHILLIEPIPVLIQGLGWLHPTFHINIQRGAIITGEFQSVVTQPSQGLDPFTIDSNTEFRLLHTPTIQCCYKIIRMLTEEALLEARRHYRATGI